MKKLFIALPIVLFFACSNNAAPEVQEPSSETVHTNGNDTIITSATPVILNGCYQMTMKKDSASLQIEVKDSLVTGTLKYNLYQKDRNNGTIKGKIKDDLIIADYEFSSEGMTSTREVVFKIKDDSLWPGFGNVSENNNGVVFENINTLQYDSIHPFIKIPCR